MNQSLKKIKQLTNKWGIYQHANYNKPNPMFGYAIEDQARALLVADDFGEPKLSHLYFKFILNAQDKNGKIYQYFYDHEKLGIKADKAKEGSPDSLGMIAWALLTTKKNHQKKDSILKNILTQAKNWPDLRAIAYLILGLINGKNSLLEKRLINKILISYKEDGNWHWFENRLSYGNALIPWALWKHGQIRQDQKSLNIAKKSTDFLLDIYQKNGTPLPTSHLGLNKNYKKRLYFDQQPIEAAYLILCLEAAFNATNIIFYKKMAKKWWTWFWGNNINQAQLIDKNFACYDGITNKNDKVNQNQGAESNICFLMAYLAIKRLNLLD